LLTINAFQNITTNRESSRAALLPLGLARRCISRDCQFQAPVFGAWNTPHPIGPVITAFGEITTVMALNLRAFSKWNSFAAATALGGCGTICQPHRDPARATIMRKVAAGWGCFKIPSAFLAARHFRGVFIYQRHRI
jgi:hypothetical protein